MPGQIEDSKHTATLSHQLAGASTTMRPSTGFATVIMNTVLSALATGNTSASIARTSAEPSFVDGIPAKLKHFSSFTSCGFCMLGLC